MTIFDNFGDTFGKIFNPIVDVGKSIVMPFAGVFDKGSQWVEAIGSKAGDVIDKGIQLPEKIVDTVGNLGGKIVDVGSGLLNKFTDILSSPFTIILIAGGLFLVLMLVRK